ncbi:MULTISPECIES: hypothetical protein [Pseudofrankia]|uniref:hypothetical protein n=1 Tax=Pseudofrankia TaxID=2994363 RepID=UPI001E3F7198|nr:MULTISPECIES: hypothetical protein [Pseudofrankia]
MRDLAEPGLGLRRWGGDVCAVAVRAMAGEDVACEDGNGEGCDDGCRDVSGVERAGYDLFFHHDRPVFLRPVTPGSSRLESVARPDLGDAGCCPVKGTVFKRCHCTDPVTGKELGKSGPKSTRSDHGGWWYRHDIPPGLTAGGARPVAVLSGQRPRLGKRWRIR